jgi:predicted ArsR family transcriptional regulator
MAEEEYAEREVVPPQADAPPPGTPGNPLRLTDPRMMRALAHPARIAIWEHLTLEGPATATECAEVAGLSPSACSYHLRTLARYGFVEEDLSRAADGRQRPWRVKVVAISFGDGPDATPGTLAAGRMLEETFQASAEELRESYMDRRSEYPLQWRQALGGRQDVLHVTPEELTGLRQRMTELMGEYRRLDRAERPDGSRRVHVRLDVSPWFEPDKADAPEEEAEEAEER